MRRIPRPRRSAQPADANPPNAPGGARLRQPSAQLFGLPDNRGAYIPLSLPAEDRNLLTARLTTAEEALAADRPGRPACRILAVSHIDHHQTGRPRYAEILDFESAVAQNLLLLNPGDTTAQGYLDVLAAARPILTDRDVTR